MTTKCNVCGREFKAARSDARFCSPKCRVQNHRHEHGAVSEPRKRRPLPDAFWEATYDLERKAERLQRLAHDDRMPRNRAAIAVRNLPELLMARDSLDEAIRVLDSRYGKPLIETVTEKLLDIERNLDPDH